MSNKEHNLVHFLLFLKIVKDLNLKSMNNKSIISQRKFFTPCLIKHSIGFQKILINVLSILILRQK